MKNDGVLSAKEMLQVARGDKKTKSEAVRRNMLNEALELLESNNRVIKKLREELRK
jgi:hypothetical protein